MKKLMTIAWMLVKQYHYTMSEAMKLGWQVRSLKHGMKLGTVEFAYRKTDGTIRHAVGTLTNAKLNTLQFAASTANKDINQLRYFDVEANGWRSCLISNLI